MEYHNLYNKIGAALCIISITNSPLIVEKKGEEKNEIAKWFRKCIKALR